MDDRRTLVERQLVATLPWPQPTAGPRFGRVLLQAAAVAPRENIGPGIDPEDGTILTHEEQAEAAIEQMDLGTTQDRIDSAASSAPNEYWRTRARQEIPTATGTRLDNWGTVLGIPRGALADTAYRQALLDGSTTEAWGDSASTWRFQPRTTERGASGEFLDFWGRTLTVPRNPGEADRPYRRRIVQEIATPATTNMGMAAAIDAMLGCRGTTVQEPEGVLEIPRFNNRIQANSGTRMGVMGAFGATSAECTFLVTVPCRLTAANGSVQDVQRLVDRRRAAGTRCLAIVQGTAYAPILDAPGTIRQGEAFLVTTQEQPGALYHWSVTGCYVQGGTHDHTITCTPMTADLRTITVGLQVDLQDGRPPYPAVSHTIHVE